MSKQIKVQNFQQPSLPNVISKNIHLKSHSDDQSLFFVEEELAAKDLETTNEPDRILSPLESKWLQDVSQRISSVQEMICMTASGESFPVPVE